MLNMLLVYDFWNDYLLTIERMVGLGLIMVGIALALCAKRLTRVIKKDSTVDKGDSTYARIVTVAFVIILAGMITAIL